MTVRRPGLPDLPALVDALARRYPAGRTLTDPLALIVWENVGYLVDDARRTELFEAFNDRIGLDAAAIMAAPPALLLDLARRGGMRPETRAARLRAIGELALVRAGGDLGAQLRALPSAKARRLLKLFPGIGDPGADKILLFSGIETRPALESNGLRVLARLGFFAEQAGYARNYRAGIEVLAERGRMDRAWLVRAWSALRAHGQVLCRRGVPLCSGCPVDPICAHVSLDSL